MALVGVRAGVGIRVELQDGFRVGNEALRLKLSLIMIVVEAPGRLTRRRLVRTTSASQCRRHGSIATKANTGSCGDSSPKSKDPFLVGLAKVLQLEVRLRVARSQALV
jgi:hypothetical protein